MPASTAHRTGRRCTCVPSPRVYGNLWQQQKATHTHTSGKDTEPALRQGLPVSLPQAATATVPFPAFLSPRPVSAHHPSLVELILVLLNVLTPSLPPRFPHWVLTLPGKERAPLLPPPPALVSPAFFAEIVSTCIISGDGVETHWIFSLLTKSSPLSEEMCSCR